MIFYLYSGDFFKLKEWTKFNCIKLLTTHSGIKIKISLAENQHQIEVEERYLEIVSENMPIIFLPKSIEIDPARLNNVEQDSPDKAPNNFLLISENKNTKISLLPYSLKHIDDFLRDKDCLFHYSSENDKWSIVKWSETDNQVIIFSSLKTVRHENSVLMTSSRVLLNS